MAYRVIYGPIQYLRACVHMAMSDKEQSPVKRCVYVVDPDVWVRRRLESILVGPSRTVKTFASAEAFLAQERAIAAGCLVI